MAAQVLRLDLRRVGVTIGGGAAVGVAVPGAAPIASVESPPLSALVRHMDVYSDNFYAEMLMKEIGAVQGTAGSAAAGPPLTPPLLSPAGRPPARGRIGDRSGPSPLDRPTPPG